MNWTVRRVVKLTAEMAAQADEVCQHLEVGQQAIMIGEQDSFGPVTRFYMCQTCIDNEEKETTVRCDDCGAEKPSSSVTAWKWYDFYAPQGDEPIMVCDECISKPKHRARVAKDEADYNREFGHSSFDEDDY